MSTIGALLGLGIAIWLISRRVPAAYSLMLGALAGGLAGGMDPAGCISAMTDGVKDITPAILRILSAGVLSGVLIQTGAAEAISTAIIRRLGRDNIYAALAIATMLLCAVGVFIDVAVITVAPIALSVHRRYGLSPLKLLIMMIGGGKCGNIISPNPNTIIAAENFDATLSVTMAANIIPAAIGLLFTIFIIKRIFPDGHSAVPTASVAGTETPDAPSGPSFAAAIAGPVVTIALLALRPIAGVAIDPLVALPAGGLAGLIVMRRMRTTLSCIDYGLSKMIPVAILLVGTGTIAGIIKASSMKDVFIDMLSGSALGETLIAPVSGMLMSAATASTTAGATLASSSFAPTVLAAGIAGAWGAAMINSGATMLDHLPHGSFFHATGGAMGVDFKHRMRLIPYETAIGFVLAALTTACYELYKLL